MEASARDYLEGKALFYGPVLTVIFFACSLAFVAYMSNITIQATFFVEEGSSGQKATAGILNALTFILPAVIGGFGMVYLFKYRKKLTLKYLFGGTFFFAGSFIAYFFTTFVIRIAAFKLNALDMVTPGGQLMVGEYPFEALFYSADLGFGRVYLFQAASWGGCALGGFLLSYTIVSRRFNTQEKNTALLVLGGLMGAFLAIILPTWTVLAMLIGLSMYDIYAVRQGPIRDIVNVAIEEEEKMDRERQRLRREAAENALPPDMPVPVPPPLAGDDTGMPPRARPISPPASPGTSGDGPAGQQGAPPARRAAVGADEIEPGSESGKGGAGGGAERLLCICAKERDVKMRRREPLISRFGSGDKPKKTWKQKEEETDLIINSMTYSADEWELGIGDLVFYSMLTAHALTFASAFVPDHGLMAPFIVVACTTIGILIGFRTTIRLLEKYQMLPGLPIPLSLGITGFLASSAVYMYIL